MKISRDYLNKWKKESSLMRQIAKFCGALGNIEKCRALIKILENLVHSEILKKRGALENIEPRFTGRQFSKPSEGFQY